MPARKPIIIVQMIPTDLSLKIGSYADEKRLFPEVVPLPKAGARCTIAVCASEVTADTPDLPLRSSGVR